ncbi:hypothetical protein ABKN59_009517 [Abortiporus biennis]
MCGADALTLSTARMSANAKRPNIGTFALMKNHILVLCVQIALLYGFNLLDSDSPFSPDSPLYATLYIGVEPSDIYQTMHIL